MFTVACGLSNAYCRYAPVRGENPRKIVRYKIGAMGLLVHPELREKKNRLSRSQSFWQRYLYPVSSTSENMYFPALPGE